ncbi:MAG: DUF4405 domain-containing protein [archaeon]
MNKNKLNYFIDVLLGLSFLVVLITGILKFRGFLGLFGIDWQILKPYNISLIHDWSGVIMGLMVFMHLALHWKWIVCMTRNFILREGNECKYHK